MYTFSCIFYYGLLQDIEYGSLYNNKAIQDLFLNMCIYIYISLYVLI